MKNNERKIKIIKRIIVLLFIILILFIFLVSWQKIIDEEKFHFNYSTEEILLSIRNDELKNINLKKNQGLSYNLNVENAKKMDIGDYQKLADEINYQAWDKEENDFYIDQIYVFWNYDNELYIESIDYTYEYLDADDGDINIFTSTLKTTEIDIDGVWESINVQRTTYRTFPFFNRNQSFAKETLSATEALEIVEKKGGEFFRNKNNNNCVISGDYTRFGKWDFRYTCDGGIEERIIIDSITGEISDNTGESIFYLVILLSPLIFILIAIIFIPVMIIKVIRKKRNSSKEEEQNESN